MRCGPGVATLVGMKVDPRIVTSVAALVAGLAVNKLISTSWKAATGRAAPTDPEHPDLDLREAVVFAVVSGALIALARLAAVRGAQKYVVGRLEKRTG